jgi:tetratricopeptide (TPR) repeat protein
MRRIRVWVLCLLALGALSGRASAQLFDRLTNSKISVTVKHPPGLHLQVNRVAFGPASGPYSDELLAAIQADFVSSHMEVLDRQHLQSTLAEHQFNLSGYVDPQTAVRMGKFLGSTALVMLTVSRAHTDSIPTYAQTNRGIVYLSTVRSRLKGTIQTIDLTTGRVFQATPFDAVDSMVTSSMAGRPEYPDGDQVDAVAEREVVRRIHQMFLPWIEVKRLYFFNDKDCGMKVGYEFLKGNNIDEAKKASDAALESCKSTLKPDDKHLAHAYYNTAMVALLQGQFDQANDLLVQAEKTKHIDISTEAMLEVKQAQASDAAYREVAAQAQVPATRFSSEGAPPTSSASGADREVARPPSRTPVTTRRVAAVPAAARQSTTPARSSAAKSPAKDPTPPKATAAERLKALNDLFKQGLISKPEYDKKKAAILSEM